MFAWKYEYLITYDTSIIEHKIPLKEEAKPFRYKLRQINPYSNVILNKISDHHIVQLPRNRIPKGLVPLERLFDRNDVVVKFKGSTDDDDITE